MLSQQKPSFTSAVVEAMKDIIYQCLKDAMEESLKRAADTDDNRVMTPSQMCEEFARAGRDAVDKDLVGKLVNAVDSYIKSAGIIINSPQSTLVSPAGSVSGVVVVKPNDVQIV